MTLATWYCQHCGRGIDMLLPVEPLYTLESAALLVPTTVGALQRWIGRLLCPI